MADDTRSGEVEPPVSGADIRTFLFADMRGYTRYTQAHGDGAASALAGRFADLVREAVPELDGELLELRGDEALCVFRSTRQALRASVELQRRLRTAPEGQEAFPIGVGMGLDAGEAVPTQGGYRGSALNLAARLCALAKPGEILASEAVVHLARRVDGLRYSASQTGRLKGLDEPARWVVVEPVPPLPPAPAVPQPVRNRRRAAALGGACVIALAVAFIVIYGLGHGGTHHAARPVLIRSNSVVVVNLQGHVVGDLPLAAVPDQVTSGADAVWVGEDTSQSIQRIDPNGHADAPIGLGMQPAQLLVAFHAVWAYDASTNRLTSIDPSGRLQPDPPSSPLPPCGDCGAGGLAADGTGLWLGRCCTSSFVPIAWAWHLNPRTLKRTQKVGHVPSERLVFGSGELWAYGANGFFVARVIPQSGQVTNYRIATAAVYNSPGLTYAFQAAWAVSPAGNLLEFNQAGLQQPTATIPKGGYDVARGGNSLWVTGGDGTITKVSPFTARHRIVLRLHHAAYGIAYFKHRMWIAVGGAVGGG